MMNKIEEYLNSLDRKNLIMLYLSFVVLGIIFYYNVNYNIFSQKIAQNDTKIQALKIKLLKTKNMQKRIVVLKKEYKKHQKILLSLQEDLKYLKMLIATSDVLHIDDKKFIKIINKILDYGIENNIKASYEISKSEDEFKKYKIRLTGVFNPVKYKNFLSFISDIEKIKAVKNFTYVTFGKEKNSTISYKADIIFWSLK